MISMDIDSDDDVPLAKVARKRSLDDEVSVKIDKVGTVEHIHKPPAESIETEVAKKSTQVPSDTDICVSKFDIYFDYEWPQNRSGCYYVIVYFMAKFLKVDYHDDCFEKLKKRPISTDEKLYLDKKGVLSEIPDCVDEIYVSLCEDACEFMADCFPKEFLEYLKQVKKRDTKKLMIKQELQRASSKNVRVPAFIRRALKETVRYNKQLNEERREERQAYFDLQTQIIHLPQKKQKYDPSYKPKRSEYPVALLPGQYQDYFRRYTSDELSSIPLKTVTKPLWKKSIQTPSEDNDKQEEALSPGDALSDTAKESGQEELINKVEEGKDPFCGICMKGPETNKFGVFEKLIHCSQCVNSGHPTCLDMSRHLVTVISTYPWQCMECKVCSECLGPHDEESMMFCDNCDRGYHSYCVGLKEIPKGRWVCLRCGKCASCLNTEPVQKGETGRWKNEFSKPVGGGEPEFLQTHCHSCSRFFRKGNFCPVCLKAYGNDEDLASPMVCCDQCDRWIHIDCDAIDEKRYNQLCQDQKEPYTCVLCRGEKEERYDAFHKKYR